MKHYFITGTSRGIGKALAEKLLEKNNVKITGIARNKTIFKDNYTHLFFDLSKPELISKFEFPPLPDAKEITLINNAGVISEIKRFGMQKNKTIINDYNVNIISPSILINNFIKKYQHLKNKRVILNISSGAGRHTVDAWSVYCSSKSALDMLSENIKTEQSFYPDKNRIKIYSVAPGVIETKMQEQIRQTSEKDFSDVKKFINLKNDGMLASPEETAEKLLKIIEKEYSEVILDVRNL